MQKFIFNHPSIQTHFHPFTLLPNQRNIISNIHSFIHPTNHPFSLPSIHSKFHMNNYPSIHSPIKTYPAIYSLIHLITHSYILPFFYHPSTQSTIHTINHSFNHLLTPLLSTKSHINPNSPPNHPNVQLPNIHPRSIHYITHMPNHSSIQSPINRHTHSSKYPFNQSHIHTVTHQKNHPFIQPTIERTIHPITHPFN